MRFVIGSENGDFKASLRQLGNGEVALLVEDSKYTIALDYEGGDNVIYAGEALPGSSKSAAVWRIKKLTYNGSKVTDVQWANGANTFANIWDNRAAFIYS